MDNAIQVTPVDDFEIIEEPAREPFIVDDDSKADYEGIADQIERSKRLWENVGLDGLVKRREPK